MKAGRWQFTARRTEVGGLLLSWTWHTRSWQAHLTRFDHRPVTRRDSRSSLTGNRNRVGERESV